MSRELVNLLAKKFIARTDVKAIQTASGGYMPDRSISNGTGGSHGLGFDRKSLERHLDGDATYGHYLLDQNDRCKLFVLDVDLEKSGSWVKFPDPAQTDPHLSEEQYAELCEIHKGAALRDVWASRKRDDLDARKWLKYQMHAIASKLVGIVHGELGLPCVAAYSGSKGVHVYGFTGLMDATEVREGALLALDMSAEFQLSRGKNFFMHTSMDPILGFQNFSVEVYPKQSSLEGKDLGNLVRLPLGKNLHNPKDPTFFLDLKVPMWDLKPHGDPVALLTSGNPYL